VLYERSQLRQVHARRYPSVQEQELLLLSLCCSQLSPVPHTCFPPFLSQLYNWDFSVFDLNKASNGRPLFSVTLALLKDQGLLVSSTHVQQTCTFDSLLHELQTRSLASHAPEDLQFSCCLLYVAPASPSVSCTASKKEGFPLTPAAVPLQ
jgi:hypothetical protein